jgi:hypothetical protein
MHAQGLLNFEPDLKDARVRHAVFTPSGRALHDRIIKLALLREEVAISVLNDNEVEIIRDLLRRVHANLDQVDLASQEFVRLERSSLGISESSPALRRRGAIRGTTSQTDKHLNTIKKLSSKRKI